MSRRLKKLHESKAIVSDCIRKLERLPLPKSDLLETRRIEAESACRKAYAALEAMIESETRATAKITEARLKGAKFYGSPGADLSKGIILTDGDSDE